MSLAPRLHPRRHAEGEHPAGGDGLWGTGTEVPSFLYAMQLPDGKVFLEETCLVAKPALPFATLKRRLHRRLNAMGIKVCLWQLWTSGRTKELNGQACIHI